MKKTIIWISNKYLPEEVKKKASKKVSSVASSLANTIDPKKMAAIVTAVDIVTKGKGKVSDIKKI